MVWPRRLLSRYFLEASQRLNSRASIFLGKPMVRERPGFNAFWGPSRDDVGGAWGCEKLLLIVKRDRTVDLPPGQTLIKSTDRTRASSRIKSPKGNDFDSGH